MSTIVQANLGYRELIRIHTKLLLNNIIFCNNIINKCSRYAISIN